MTNNELSVRAIDDWFLTAINSSLNAWLLVNEGGTVLFANQQAQHDFGYAESEWFGMSIDRLVPQSALYDHVSNRESFWTDPGARHLGLDRTVEGLRKDGTRFPIEISLSPFETAEGRFTSCEVRDITARQEAEEAERLHRQEVAHVARVSTMGQLATALAHELNQPLAAIVSNAQAGRRMLAAEAFDQTDVTEALLDIVAEGKRASEIIEHLRAFLKRSEDAFEPLLINSVVSEVAQLIQRDVESRDIRLAFDLATRSPTVSGDRIQLQQLLINLLLNGADAITEASGSAAELTVSTSVDDSGNVLVAVSDSGIGLGPEDHDNLFDPFYTTKHQGMGIGLSICRTIAGAHGGRIWAEPNQDSGTTFYFELPVSSEASE